MSVEHLSAAFRRLAHEKLDEALELYEQGEPLWIKAGCGFTTNTGSIEVLITIKPMDNL